MVSKPLSEQLLLIKLLPSMLSSKEKLPKLSNKVLSSPSETAKSNSSRIISLLKPISSEELPPKIFKSKKTPKKIFLKNKLKEEKKEGPEIEILKINPEEDPVKMKKNLEDLEKTEKIGPEGQEKTEKNEKTSEETKGEEIETIVKTEDPETMKTEDPDNLRTEGPETTKTEEEKEDLPSVGPKSQPLSLLTRTLTSWQRYQSLN